MILSTRILGSTAVKQLQAAGSAWVLEVGSDRLTRGELARVGCYNYHAARLLTATLRGSGVKHLADLYARLSPAALALPRLGVISLAVLGAAFETKGIGGAAPLESWMTLHAGRKDDALVSFHTLKRHERAEAARPRSRRRARHAA